MDVEGMLSRAGTALCGRRAAARDRTTYIYAGEYMTTILLI